MYEAYLCHVGGEEEQAKEILRRFKDQTFLREDLEMAGAYLYLCTLTGLYRDSADYGCI